MSYSDYIRSTTFRTGIDDNGRYTKLGRVVRKIKFIIKKPLYIASRHFCTFARFEVIFDKVVSCKEIVQILWNAFFGICSYTQNISITSSTMSSKPSFTKIWANVRQENVSRLVRCNVSRRRQRR